MGKKVVLSVIVPIYNGELYLDSLIKMICQQGFESFELILVDDGSTDGTYEKCKQYMQKYEWIQVIHTENQGVSHARNTGIEAASGEWIQFLDVDDKFYRDMFCDFYQSAQTEQPELIVCSCIRKNLEIGSAENCGPKKDRVLDEKNWKYIFYDLEMEVRYWLLDYIWNKWYRNDIIKQYGLRFECSLSLGEDFVFNTQYFQYVQRAVLLKRVYYQYLVGTNGLASRFSPKPWIGRMKLYEAQKNLYTVLGIWDSQKENTQIQAGQIAFGDIRTINRKNCFYTDSEKVQFVQDMIKSEQFSFLLCYLKQKKSILFQIYYYVCLTRNASLISKLIKMEKIIQERKLTRKE